MMDNYQLTAVGHHLNYWPDDINFQKLIERLTDEDYGFDDDELIVCDHLGYNDGWFVADLIKGLERYLRTHFLVKNHECN